MFGKSKIETASPAACLREWSFLQLYGLIDRWTNQATRHDCSTCGELPLCYTWPLHQRKLLQSVWTTKLLRSTQTSSLLSQRKLSGELALVVKTKRTSTNDANAKLLNYVSQFVQFFSSNSIQPQQNSCFQILTTAATFIFTHLPVPCRLLPSHNYLISHKDTWCWKICRSVFCRNSEVSM